MAENDSDKSEHALARKGIRLIINNNCQEAERLFMNHQDSLVMYSGYSYSVFIDALLAFEDEKISKVMTVLKEIEKRCSTRGWFRSMFGGANQKQSLAVTLESQIILADTQILLALLIFLEHDISGYLKGCWTLRKAWKLYSSTYQEILKIYNSKIGALQLPGSSHSVDFTDTLNKFHGLEQEILQDPGAFRNPDTAENGYLPRSSITQSQSAYFGHRPTSDDNSNLGTAGSPGSGKMKKSFSVNSALEKSTGWGATIGSLANSLSFSNLSSTFQIFSSSTDNLKYDDMDKETIIRLMNAVSFGYGIFQLGISLLPPSLIKIVHFFGMNGNRSNGIACLLYARLGIDMRAPLATLTLLWYHTIVRPYYSVDGPNIRAGVSAATQLIQESAEEYSNSAFFLFFKGRLHRLNSDIANAIISFQASADNANQKELKLLSLHEVGWCYLIRLEYDRATEKFGYLKKWSRWCRPFFMYIAMICMGAINSLTFVDIEEMKDCLMKMSKNTEIDDFLKKRLVFLPHNEEELQAISDMFWKLLVFEILYLWNALPSCTEIGVDEILRECKDVAPGDHNEPILGLGRLVLGTCYAIKGDKAQAIESYRECVESNKKAPVLKYRHVLAFSLYELGAILVKSEETRAEAEDLLKQSYDLKGYDFEHKLNVRVNGLLKHIHDGNYS